MIVIATFNGHEVLPRLLDSINLHGAGGHSVVVVDNGSTNDNSKEYFAGLPYAAYDFPVVTLQNSGGYETGAFLAAWRLFKNAPVDAKDSLILLQDSLEVTSHDWAEQFEQRLARPLGAVAWMTWCPLMLYRFPEDDAIIQKYGEDNLPEFGIFGSIFSTTYDTMDVIEKAGYFDDLPQTKTKLDSCIMERAWSIAFHRLNIPVNIMAPDGYWYFRNGGELPIMRKVLVGRE